SQRGGVDRRRDAFHPQRVVHGPRRKSDDVRLRRFPQAGHVAGAVQIRRAGRSAGGTAVMAQEFSFDIVSETDMQEVAKAVQQAQKELAQRFDFKGSKSSIELAKDEIVLVSDDEGKLRSVKDILETKLVKRHVALKALDYGKVEPAAGGTVRQHVKIVQGIE